MPLPPGRNPLLTPQLARAENEAAELAAVCAKAAREHRTRHATFAVIVFDGIYKGWAHNMPDASGGDNLLAAELRAIADQIEGDASRVPPGFD